MLLWYVLQRYYLPKKFHISRRSIPCLSIMHTKFCVITVTSTLQVCVQLYYADTDDCRKLKIVCHLGEFQWHNICTTYHDNWPAASRSPF